MAHDVFISYSTKDQAAVGALLHRLEECGIRCWIAPRNIKAGDEYAGSISDALQHAAVVVLVFSGNANRSKHVPKEMELAVSFGKRIIPFSIEKIEPSSSLGYYIKNLHSINAVTPPLGSHLNELTETIKEFLPATFVGPLPSKEPSVCTVELPDTPILYHIIMFGYSLTAWIFWGMLGLIVLCAPIALIETLVNGHKGNDANSATEGRTVTDPPNTPKTGSETSSVPPSETKAPSSPESGTQPPPRKTNSGRENR